MTRALAVMFVTATLLASPAAAQGFRRGTGFVHPGFFPHGFFVNNRVFFKGFFVGPGFVPVGFPFAPPVVVYAPPPLLYVPPPVYAPPPVRSTFCHRSCIIRQRPVRWAL